MPKVPRSASRCQPSGQNIQKNTYLIGSSAPSLPVRPLAGDSSLVGLFLNTCDPVAAAATTGREVFTWFLPCSGSKSTLFSLSKPSYLLRRSSNSRSGNRLRRCRVTDVGTHWTCARVQLSQGIEPVSRALHFTLRCWQSTQANMRGGGLGAWACEADWLESGVGIVAPRCKFSPKIKVAS